MDKLIAESENPEHRLKKSLGPWSLTALGIGAIIGSGIFVLTGTAAAGEHFEVPSILHAQVLDLIVNFFRTGGTGNVLMHGRPAAGPAIAISFILVAMACSFAGLCYAELASMIPIAGSAYTYSYATLGEIFAWIIGWDLILEYAVSNMAVAVGFSAYIDSLFQSFGIHLPAALSTPAYTPATGWSPHFNLPGFLIIMALTVLLVRGVKESDRANKIMVSIKLVAILIFVVFASAYVQPKNWSPFMPNGFQGVLTGSAIVFFTYIGFDSVSTAAEECKEPRRTVPRGILLSLGVCALCYCAVAIVLTGIQHYSIFLGDAAPVATALRNLRLYRIERWVTVGALTGMISSLLAFQYSQARVWMCMSRDGLLPEVFKRRHRRYDTPHVSTWAAGFVVGIPAGLFDIGTLADLSNIGTLFAFVLVSIAVLVLRKTHPERERHFRAPCVWLVAPLSVLFCFVLMAGLPLENWIRFFIWLVLGLCIYFGYSRKRSLLGKLPAQAGAHAS
ncbi:MAG TPA: amino acid permease [Polyangia bacterium]|nr:amino acid permease [Polyangia bacterium]